MQLRPHPFQALFLKDRQLDMFCVPPYYPTWKHENPPAGNGLNRAQDLWVVYCYLCTKHFRCHELNWTRLPSASSILAFIMQHKSRLPFLRLFSPPAIFHNDIVNIFSSDVFYMNPTLCQLVIVNAIKKRMIPFSFWKMPSCWNESPIHRAPYKGGADSTRPKIGSSVVPDMSCLILFSYPKQPRAKSIKRQR
jgi:hypothetical protein